MSLPQKWLPWLLHMSNIYSDEVGGVVIVLLEPETSTRDKQSQSCDEK